MARVGQALERDGRLSHCEVMISVRHSSQAKMYFSLYVSCVSANTPLGISTIWTIV